MAQTGRPLSPHLSVYRWGVQMTTSILHRATGIALAVGTLVVLWGLLALAGGADSWASFKGYAGGVIGTVVLIGWTWALSFHLCNGIRHLIQDGGAGFAIADFKRSSWLAIVGSIVLTVLVWAFVFMGGAA